MDVRLPDGTIVRNVPDGTTKADLIAKLKANGHDIPAEWAAPAPSQPKVADKPLAERVADAMPHAQSGIGDAALSLASSAVAGPLSGLAGIAGAVLPGPEGQGADFVRRAQQALTYEPKTTTGKVVTDVASLPAEGLAKAGGFVGEKVREATDSPLAATAADVATQAAGVALAKKAFPGETASAKAKRLQERTANAQRDAAAVSAQESGYVLPPSQAVGGKANAVLEGFGGKVKTAQRLSEKNQPVTNQLAREEFGLSSDTKLNADTLQEIRRNAGQAYNAVRNSGQVVVGDEYMDRLAAISEPYEKVARDFPKSKPSPIIEEAASALEPTFDASSAVDRIIDLREKAYGAMRGERPNRVEAKAYRAIADALEEELGRHLQRSGAAPNVIANFRDARATIAKTYTLEKALNDATGNVDAKKLGSRLGKDPLTGNLLRIAEFGKAFPKAAQMPEKIGGIPTSPLDFGVAAIGGLAGGLAYTRPLVREIVSSRPYQNALVRPPSYGPSLAGELLTAETNALAPLSAALPDRRDLASDFARRLLLTQMGQSRVSQ